MLEGGEPFEQVYSFVLETQCYQKQKAGHIFRALYMYLQNL